MNMKHSQPGFNHKTKRRRGFNEKAILQSERSSEGNADQHSSPQTSTHSRGFHNEKKRKGDDSPFTPSFQGKALLFQDQGVVSGTKSPPSDTTLRNILRARTLHSSNLHPRFNFGNHTAEAAPESLGLLASQLGPQHLSSMMFPHVALLSQNEIRAKRQCVNTMQSGQGLQFEAAKHIQDLDMIAAQLRSPTGISLASMNPQPLEGPSAGSHASLASLSVNDMRQLLSKPSSEQPGTRRNGLLGPLQLSGGSITDGLSSLNPYGDNINIMQLAQNGNRLPSHLPMLPRETVGSTAEATAAPPSFASVSAMLPSLLHGQQQALFPLLSGRDTLLRDVNAGKTSQRPDGQQTGGMLDQELLRRGESRIASVTNTDPTSGSATTLYLPSCDEDRLSDYQVLVRKQIEFFEADSDDVEIVVPGRRKGLVLGQVGVRCIHCARLPVHHRSPGTAYFPSKLNGVYQAAQNLAKSHLCEHCAYIPKSTRQELIVLRESGTTAGHGGKKYWADGARALGVHEKDDVLRFA